ncbi:MAG: CRISPR-associated ring nuclease [Nanopusillaceae archaeon]
MNKPTIGIVNILGKAPGVVTEFVEWLYPNFYIDPVYIITTKDEKVKLYYQLLTKVLYKKYRINKNRIIEIELPFDDPQTTDDIITVFREIRKNVPDDRKLLFNVSGGRKNMVLVVYLASLLYKSSSVYYILMKNEQVARLDIEMVEGEIRAYLQGDESPEIENRIYSLLFPNKETYEFVEVPKIPLLDFYIDILKEVLSMNKIQSGQKTINIKDVIGELVRKGYLQKKDENLYLTKEGENLSKLLE